MYSVHTNGMKVCNVSITSLLVYISKYEWCIASRDINVCMWVWVCVCLCECECCVRRRFWTHHYLAPPQDHGRPPRQLQPRPLDELIAPQGGAGDHAVHIPSRKATCVLLCQPVHILEATKESMTKFHIVEIYSLIITSVVHTNNCNCFIGLKLRTYLMSKI